MKRIVILILISIISSFSFAQTDIDEYKFFINLEFGVSDFFNRSGVSSIDYEQNHYPTTKYSFIIGLDNSKDYLGLDIFASEIGAKYNHTLTESIGLYGIGAIAGYKYHINETLFAESNMGIGFLGGVEQITYNKKDLDAINRLGFYVKLGLGLGVEVNKMSFGLKGDVLGGYLQDKRSKLPTELKEYKNQNNRMIDACNISVFFKVKM